MLHSPLRRGLPEALETIEMCLRNWRGVVFTWLGGKSCFLWQWYWNRKRVSSSPWILKRGSLVPRAVSAWKINCMESSTLRNRSGHLLRSMTPVRYCLLEALRMGTGSLYKTSKDLGAMYLHTADHFSQCPSVATAMLVYRPSAMSSDAERKIFRKWVHLAGYTVTMASSVGRWCPCGRAVQHRWDLVSRRGGLRYLFPLCSQSCFRLHICGTADVWSAVWVDGLVRRLRLRNLFSATTVQPCCLSRIVWFVPVRHNNPPCMCGESLCRPVQYHYWRPYRLGFSKTPVKQTCPRDIATENNWVISRGFRCCFNIAGMRLEGPGYWNGYWEKSPPKHVPGGIMLSIQCCLEWHRFI